MQLTSNISTTNSSFFKYYEKARKNSYSRYELSNHLGNPEKSGEPVLAVITDRRIQTCGMGDVMHYEAQVVSISDYYPFGMGIKDREWKDSTFSYRFGFQGQEKDDEIKGDGNNVEYKYRIYDSRIGRFLSTDPLESDFAWNSPYVFSENKVIAYIEFEGLQTGRNNVPYNLNNQNNEVYVKQTATKLRNKTTRQINEENAIRQNLINRTKVEIPEPPIIDNPPHSGGQTDRNSQSYKKSTVEIIVQIDDVRKSLKIPTNEFSIVSQNNGLDKKYSFKNKVIFNDRTSPFLKELNDMQANYDKALETFVNKAVGHLRPTWPTKEEIKTNPNAIKEFNNKLNTFNLAAEIKKAEFKKTNVSPWDQLDTKAKEQFEKEAKKDRDNIVVTSTTTVIPTISKPTPK